MKASAGARAGFWPFVPSPSGRFPRLLIVAVRGDVPLPDVVSAEEPAGVFHLWSIRNSIARKIYT